MKKAINLDTVFLMTSLELITGMVNQLDQVGRQITKAHSYGLVTEKDRDAAYLKVGKEINTLEDTRIELSKELNRRFKEYLGVSKGPNDVDTMVKNILKEHPCIAYDEDQMIKNSPHKTAKLSPVKE